jgi:hypothetical protein
MSFSAAVKAVPFGKKRISGAKALVVVAFYGTAKAMP